MHKEQVSGSLGEIVLRSTMLSCQNSVNFDRDVNPALRLRQEDCHEFKSYVGYIVNYRPHQATM